MLINRNNNPMEADFSAVRLAHHRVLVVDLDLGSRSVTNDAHNVCAILASCLPLHPQDRVFYRDSDGEIDELVLNGKRQFQTYAPVPVTQLLPILQELRHVSH